MGSVTALLKDYILGVAHTGFVVPDLEVAIDGFRRLYGLNEQDIRYEPAEMVDPPTRFAFFTIGGLEFELIEPCSDYFKDILLSMPSGGAGINHVAWKVSDIDAAVQALEAVNIYPGHVTPEGVVSFGRKKMVYLDPATTGGLVVELIELVDES